MKTVKTILPEAYEHGVEPDLGSMTEAELAELQRLDPEAFAQLFKAAENSVVEAARADVNAFISYVLKSEQTGLPVKSAPYHRDMQLFVENNNYSVMWGHVESAKCMVPETKLYLENGAPVTVLELMAMKQRGEQLPRLLTLDTHGRLRADRALDVFYDSTARTRRIVTDHGWEVRVSLNHPVWAKLSRLSDKPENWRWVRAGDITRDHSVLVINQLPASTRSDVSPLQAFLLGLVWWAAASGSSPRSSGGKQDCWAPVLPRCKPAKRYRVAKLLHALAERLEIPIKTTRAMSGRPTHIALGCRQWLESLGLRFTDRGAPMRASDLPIGHANWSRQAAIAWVAGVSCLAQSDWGATSRNSPSRNRRYYFTTRGAGARYMPIALAKAGLLCRVKRRLSRSTRAPGVNTEIVLGTPAVAEAFSGPVTAYMRRVYPLRRGKLRERPDPWLASWMARAAAHERQASESRVIDTEDFDPSPVYGVHMENGTHITDGVFTHNTQQITIGKTLHALGRNRNLRVAIVQAKATVAVKTLASIKKYIESSEELHRVFPGLKRGDEWRIDQIRVERDSIVRTPSVLAAGVDGNILGDRFDLIICDDVITLENSQSEYMRKRVLAWLESTLLTRLVDGGRVVIIGNMWHPDDAMHVFSRRPGWASRKYPVASHSGKLNWPEQWPLERIEHYAATRTHAEVERALFCRVSDDSTSQFKHVWFERALERGTGLYGQATQAYSIPEHLIERTGRYAGSYIAMGVDLGVTQANSSSHTAMCALAFLSSGEIEMLGIERGKYTTHELLEYIISAYDRFGHPLLLVESVAAQKFLVDMLRIIRPGIRVEPFLTRGSGTSTNKNHQVWGISGIAAELEQDRWVIPRSENGAISDEIRSWVDGCQKWQPMQAKTHDSVMACWFAWNGGRRLFTQAEPPSRDHLTELSSEAGNSLWEQLTPLIER